MYDNMNTEILIPQTNITFSFEGSGMKVQIDWDVLQKAISDYCEKCSNSYGSMKWNINTGITEVVCILPSLHNDSIEKSSQLVDGHQGK